MTHFTLKKNSQWWKTPVQQQTSSLYICLTLTFPLLHFQLNHVPLKVKQLTLLCCAAGVSLTRTSRCHRSSHCPKRGMSPLTLHCAIPLKVYWCQQPCKISVAKPCFLCWHNLPLDINRCVIAWSSTRACTFLIYGGKGNCSSSLFGHVHSWRNSQNAREVCQMTVCLLANIKTTPCRFTDTM